MAWKLRGTSALLSIALAAGVASGQELSPYIQEGRARTERFQLFNRCRPMELSVASLPEGASDIGLTRKAIRAAAESRLRAARLYVSTIEQVVEEVFLGSDLTDGRPAELYVRVSVLDKTPRAFAVSVRLYRRLEDSRNGTSGLAATWSSDSFGVASDSGYILSSLSQHLDEFLADYLRVNESHCE